MLSQFESKMQDRFLKILNALVTHDENRYCFDCHQRGPIYVNVTIGSFVCTNCGGALRKYNHRVKSISMSNFTPAEIDFIRKRGNKACRKIYLALSDDQSLDEKNFQNGARDDYLRTKYQIQKWYRRPSAELEAEAMRENQEVIDRAEQNGTQRHTSTNTAAGLVVLPSRPTVGSATSVTSIDEKSTASKQSLSKPNTPNPEPSAVSTVFDPFGTLQKDPFEPHLPQPVVSVAKPNDPFVTSALTTMQSAAVEDPFAAFKIAAPKNQQELSFKQPAEIAHPGNWLNSSSVSQNPQPNLSLPTTNAGDKYAALAELDGMLKGATVTSSSGTNAAISSIPVHSQSSIGNRNTGLWSEAFIPNGASVFTSQVAMTSATAQQLPSSAHNPFAPSIVGSTNALRHYSASNPFVTAQPGQCSFGGAPSSMQPMTTGFVPASAISVERNPAVFQPTYGSVGNPFHSSSTTNYSTSGPAPWIPHLNSNTVGPVAAPPGMNYPMNGFAPSTAAAAGFTSKNLPPVSPSGFDSSLFH